MSSSPVSPAVDEAAPASVLKPDFGAQRRHFIFTDEHEQLRESIAGFVTRELQPHADEWERTTFPDWVFPRMGELGFLGLSYPERYGGQGGDYYASLVLAEEMTKADSGGLAMGVAVHTDMAMPPILAFGTEEQKQEWVVPAIRGEKILCLGITEPDAGSDVSGIKTRAVRDGDEYVINGSKTYITNGHRADVIVLVTKTDPDAGYDGFTLFLVDMDAPGVIREKKLEKLGMHASDTALLAFDDVRVPADAVLGEVGKGWGVAVTTLAFERGSLAFALGAVASQVLTRLVALAVETGAADDPAVLGELGAFSADVEGLKLSTIRQLSELSAGRSPGAEGSAVKLSWARVMQAMTRFAIELRGPDGVAMDSPEVERWALGYLRSRGMSVEGGTDEIQKSIIAERVLGLPRSR
ncbi:MAG: acyl-CoA/acyl-ACP dehydrogenase [Actinobacteria bacterium]|nr:acyl-CoA/acyl-ACP dehydrogenase [Actinomycetota bacterium]